MSGMNRLSQKPLMTIAIIVLCAVMGMVTNVVSPNNLDLLRYGANLRELTFGGEWWRLIASAFLHGGMIHFGMNMLCLWQLGGLLERFAGRASVAFIFVMTAIVGNICSLAVHPDSIGVGASGGVFGLAGAFYAYVWIARDYLGLGREGAIGVLRGGLTFVGINFLYSLQPGIDMMAHVGGLISGAAIGAGLASVLTRRLPIRYRTLDWVLYAITAGVVLLLFLCSTQVYDFSKMPVDDDEALSVPADPGSSPTATFF